MNFADLRSDLRVAVGNPSVSDVADAVLSKHINQAYSDIADRFAFSKTRKRKYFSTAVGVSKYLMPADFAWFVKAWDKTNQRVLDKVGPRFLAEHEFTTVTNGRPFAAAYVENYLEIWPPPDGVYQIEIMYRSAVATLVADVDVPVIPAAWHKGIVMLAEWYYYRSDGKDAVKASDAYEAYSIWLQNKPVEEHEASGAVDSGVALPTLGGIGKTGTPDGAWWDVLP